MRRVRLCQRNLLRTGLPGAGNCDLQEKTGTQRLEPAQGRGLKGCSGGVAVVMWVVEGGPL